MGGHFDPLENLGGSLLQARAIDPIVQERVPSVANVVARRVTNRFFPNENAPNGRFDLLALFVKTPHIEDPIDPATGKSDIDHLADFMRFLAPPTPRRQTSASIAGAKLFERAQCDACHMSTMLTGPNSIEVLSNKPVPLYSDLLLHDMGRLGDGVEQASARAREIRTVPLWGLRVRPSILHNGRASTIGHRLLEVDLKAFKR